MLLERDWGVEADPQIKIFSHQCGGHPQLAGVKPFNPPSKSNTEHVNATKPAMHVHCVTPHVGIVELCAKILQIMRNDFKDYAHTFCQLCAPFSVLYYT